VVSLGYRVDRPYRPRWEMGYGHSIDEVLGLDGGASLVNDQEREKQGRLAAFLSRFVRLTAVGLYRETGSRWS